MKKLFKIVTLGILVTPFLFGDKARAALPYDCNDYAAACNILPMNAAPPATQQCGSSGPVGGCPSGTYCSPEVNLSSARCCLPCPISSPAGGCDDEGDTCCQGDAGTKYCEGGSGFQELECRWVNSLPICRPVICGQTPGGTCCSSVFPCDYGICEGASSISMGTCTGNPFIPPVGDGLPDLPGYDGPVIRNIAGLLAPVFKILFYAGIFVGILGIIYSGYLLISSEGDPGRVKEGKDQFTAAILGTLFVLLSVLILRVIINNILGVDSSGL